MKILVLDFDGVISDSERECWPVSVAAFGKMGEILETSPENRREFRRYRPFTKHADDYYTTLKMIQAGKRFKDISLKEFESEARKNKKKGREFHGLFYMERRKLQENMEKWVEMSPPFPGISKTVSSLIKKYKTYIATSKDRESCSILLKSYGINIPKERILSKEDSMSKRDHMKKVSETQSADYSDIVFVEDNLLQIKNVSDMGVRSILVSWGYATEEQKKEAKETGIMVVTKEDFETTVDRLMLV